MTKPRTEPLRIGCGAGFWGDTPEGPAQLVARGAVDYLVMDYLAEITMSILARMRARNPEAGYATDFVTHVMAPLLPEIARQGIRVVTNAGGVNPLACRDALAALCHRAGLDLRIAVVLGDDLAPREADLRAADLREMFTGAALPPRISSINAYLGAFPIAQALAAGADIVITGRCVDSALVLGPLIHEFGWGPQDYDLLSAGTLAGHVIECGTQCTGGICTDWREVAAGWDDMGFPIAICHPDGSFEVTKPEGSGGRIVAATVAEQITYEVGDPGAYVVPDVVCDWRAVQLEQTGPDRLRVSGARGLPPSPDYKVSATWPDGWRATATMMIAGDDAAERAEATGAAILRRAARLMAATGHAAFGETSVEVLGSEAVYGPHSTARATREVILKIGVRHAEKAALDIFAREIYPAATAMAQSLTGFAGGRPAPQPVVRLFSCLIPKADVPVEVDLDGTRSPSPLAHPGAALPPPPPARPDPAPMAGATAQVPLIRLATARSGDKGDIANIGILARDPAYLPAIRAALTPQAVKTRMAHLCKGGVGVFDWPGLSGINILLHQALGGGGVASLRHDPQGKTFAQVLLSMPVSVPQDWLQPGGSLDDQKGTAA